MSLPAIQRVHRLEFPPIDVTCRPGMFMRTVATKWGLHPYKCSIAVSPIIGKKRVPSSVFSSSDSMTIEYSRYGYSRGTIEDYMDTITIMITKVGTSGWRVTTRVNNKVTKIHPLMNVPLDLLTAVPAFVSNRCDTILGHIVRVGVDLSE